MTSGVYQILNTVNGKCYVGSSVRVEKRWAVHRNTLANGSHHSAKLMRAYSKYGGGAFVFSVLETCDPLETIAREQFWISAKDSIANGYNSRVMPDSNFGTRHTDETKAKMSATRKGNIVWTEESKSKLSKALTGKSRSLEVCEAISKRLKGVKQTPEFVEKRIAPIRGRKQTPERVAQRVATMKMTLERTKDTRPKRVGRKHSADTKLKIGAASVGRVQSAEARAKMLVASIGRVDSPETIARRVAATKATKARNKQAREDAARSCANAYAQESVH